MHIRSCFVSNSSTSSFIISLPIKDLPVEQRVNTPNLDFAIQHNDYYGYDVSDKIKEKEKYLNIAEKENCYITEVEVEGWESPEDITISLSDIPNFKVLKGKE